MVLTHPWTKLDMYLVGWVGTENICSDDGSLGALAVLDADWSVITKYRGVFDLMNINELPLSVPTAVGHRSSAARAQTNFSLLT